MGLTIHLDSPKPCYLGDEPVTGFVKFQTSTATPIKDIKITFTGRSKAKIQKVKGTGAPAATYRSKCILFAKERILFSSYGKGENEVLPPGSYEWPFEFSFPTHVQPVAEGVSARWPEKVPYRNDTGHPCPPTFALNTGDGARKLECFIDYRLEAQLFKPAAGLFSSSKAPLYTETLKLNFLPALSSSITGNDQESATYRHSREQLFTIRSKLLHMENRGRTLRMSEKISSWLSPGQLPRFSFNAVFEYPTRLIQAEPLTCSLDVVPFMEDSSVALAPEILLQALNIHVVSETGARATPSLVGAMSAEIEEKIEVLSRTALGMPVSGKVDLASIFGLLVLRHEIVSFATFNISRRYRLCASFVFECAGKTNEFNCPDLPIEIIASAAVAASLGMQETGSVAGNVQGSSSSSRNEKGQGQQDTGVMERGFIAELPSTRDNSSAEDLSPNEYSGDSDAAPPAYTPASSVPSPVKEKR
ncbi:hypothetical protein BJY01DRAFT_229778 [Aspergillus pseudoustus]|uniref:Arrestin-like N-terminal domain-containing protein n=1 Tax=Aspergillus pseudoustus TaxID=1810923 RepID=A0ABR4IF50_9EURO